MATFNIGEVGEYIPKQIAENDFLNERLENDTYGIYYSVLFEGDAETYLLQAKKPPVVGQPEWGSIEKSKSGKSMRFKRAKREDAPSPSGDKAYLKDASTIPLNVWQTLINVQGVPENKSQFETFFLTVQEHANELLRMIENVRNNVETPSRSSPNEEKPATIHDKLNKGFSKEPPLSDEDIPEELR